MEQDEDTGFVWKHLHIYTPIREITVSQALDFIYEIQKLGEENNINISIGLADVVKKIIPESEYELYSGTEFANMKTVYEPNMFTTYIPRQQVYDAIKKFSKAEKVQEISDIMDNKFPEEKFGNEFPFCASVYLLYNYYLKE